MVGGARIELHLNLAYEASQFTRTVSSNMAGKMGFEPITFRLTAERSTIELHAIVGAYDGTRTHGLCRDRATL